MRDFFAGMLLFVFAFAGCWALGLALAMLAKAFLAGWRWVYK